MKIYTKTGDDGTTSLFDGTRVQKDHERVEAYGDVDELNAALGVVLASTEDSDFRSFILQIQRDLFALGSQLANPKHKKQKQKASFSADKISCLEKEIDRFEAEIIPIRQFILPGGSLTSAYLDLARTICRRAERKIITLSHNEKIESNLVIYMNRLSDLLFMMARVANKRESIADIPWEE